MRPLPVPPPGYYERFKERPVTVKSFDPASRAVAQRYMERLGRMLDGLDAGLQLRGSTAWGIAGKGDIEIGVFPGEGAWDNVIARLAQTFGLPPSLEENYARFNDNAEEFEIEIILLRGYEAEVDRRLSVYMPAHPDLLEEYAALKQRYCFSRREYQRHKDEFFAQVVAAIPEK